LLVGTFKKGSQPYLTSIKQRGASPIKNKGVKQMKKLFLKIDFWGKTLVGRAVTFTALSVLLFKFIIYFGG
jgi:hypothetical protein